MALFAANITADGQTKPTAAANTPGDVGELDNAGGTAVVTAGARQQATADAQGVIILFAPAGKYVFKTTSTSSKGVVTVTQQTVDLSSAAGTVVLQ